MNLPHRGVANGDALDEHVTTAIRLDELRAEIATVVPKRPLSHRNAALRHLEEPVATGLLLRGAGHPSKGRVAFPGPPVRAVRLTIERSFSGDGDIDLLEGVHQRGISHELHALPAGEYRRQVARRILMEGDGRVPPNV